MGFWASYASAFRSYADFEGRTSRGVFWRFFALNLAIPMALTLGAGAVFAATSGPQSAYSKSEPSPLAYVLVVAAVLYAVAAFIPGLAIQVRRLHDVGRSGWWVLLGLLGIFGLIPLIIWWSGDATGPNAWGPGTATTASGDAPTAPAELALSTVPPPPASRTTPVVSAKLDDVLDYPGAVSAQTASVTQPADGTSALDAVLGTRDDGSAAGASAESWEDPPASDAHAADAAHQALRDMIDRRTGGT